MKKFLFAAAYSCTPWMRQNTAQEKKLGFQLRFCLINKIKFVGCLWIMKLRCAKVLKYAFMKVIFIGKHYFLRSDCH